MPDLRRIACISLAALAVVLAVATPSGAAPRRIPFGWMGMNVGGVVFDPGIDLGAQMQDMVGVGVETLRVPAFWNEIQPSPGPPDFSRLDGVVADAARRQLRVMPIVVGTPSWAAIRPDDVYSPPQGTANYAALVTALARHYGPRGDFWAAHPELPRVPIREYQIWNEVSLPGYWSIQPFARAYVALLHAAHDAIRRVDPGATIVLAGLPNFSWRDIASIYRAGGRRWFDVAAVHPYTSLVGNVVRIVQLNRQTMARYGDARKPILVGELSWSSGRGHVQESHGFLTTTESGQAQRIAQALPALAAARLRYRISQVFWFNWLSPPVGSPNAFDYAGLRRLEDGGRIVDKPAFAAYRAAARRLEGCAKGALATRCR
jgi:hypothetical protein